ncbi:hypothetical protein ACJX0J_014061 [Zea mays]
MDGYRVIHNHAEWSEKFFFIHNIDSRAFHIHFFLKSRQFDPSDRAWGFLIILLIKTQLLMGTDGIREVVAVMPHLHEFFFLLLFHQGQFDQTPGKLWSVYAMVLPIGDHTDHENKHFVPARKKRMQDIFEINIAVGGGGGGWRGLWHNNHRDLRCLFVASPQLSVAVLANISRIHVFSKFNIEILYKTTLIIPQSSIFQPFVFYLGGLGISGLPELCWALRLSPKKG